MLNKCPKMYSCGTRVPIWTDDVMPTSVGVPTAISAYQQTSNDQCPGPHFALEVVRCSWKTEHDLVYRQVVASYHTCSTAFCGMR